MPSVPTTRPVFPQRMLSVPTTRPVFPKRMTSVPTTRPVFSQRMPSVPAYIHVPWQGHIDPWSDRSISMIPQAVRTTLSINVCHYGSSFQREALKSSMNFYLLKYMTYYNNISQKE